MSTNVIAALAALAEKIDESRFSVRHVEYRKQPALRVVSLGAATLTDTIVARNDGGVINFYWSWGDKIGPAHDPGGAGQKVMRILDVHESPVVQGS
jgi:hypothetical protein